MIFALRCEHNPEWKFILHHLLLGSDEVSGEWSLLHDKSSRSASWCKIFWMPITEVRLHSLNFILVKIDETSFCSFLLPLSIVLLSSTQKDHPEYCPLLRRLCYDHLL